LRPVSEFNVLLARSLLGALACWQPVGALANPPAKKLEPTQLILTGDFAIPLRINELLVKFRVDPDSPSLLAVNPVVAQRAHLKPSMIRFYYGIGPTRIISATDGTKVEYGNVAHKDRVIWADRDVTTQAEGLVSPGALPYDKVTFVLAPTSAGETLTAVPYITPFVMFGLGQVMTKINIGGEAVTVSFNLNRQASLATAQTGLLLADSNGGTLTSKTRPTLIQYGVERPTRGMHLATPLLIGGRPLIDLLIRVSDGGDATSLPDGEPKAVDPDEIIVTGKSNKKKRRPRLTLGLSYLSGCSSITFDNREKLIKMSCSR
jgi:hypothetical protein